MFGKMNPRQMKQLMKQMGVKMESLAAEEVVIISKDKRIILKNPEVSLITAQGKKSYQISGDEIVEEREEGEDIRDEDVDLISQQAGVSREIAKAALTDAMGDIAEAIIALQKND